ncbi:MAG: ATP-binding protein [Planctomycetia bacterium]|nr:ATP-binding protein [Planctomycetia bacterium]
MLANLKTYALIGIDATLVEAEVDVSAGFPKTVIVGLPEQAVKESIHRIERALSNLGYSRTTGHTVINLAPADLKKDAGSFDLPIALGILAATEQIPLKNTVNYAFVGELALDGNLRPIKGKTMLAKRMATILPPLTLEESLETTRIYSALGRLNSDQSLLTTRPFRSPHHTISDAGMVGGGKTPAPGEISLAHHGILFLDELPEFNRRSLEVLRQPLEEGAVTISRALQSTTFPARFVLVASMNPCPCGYLGDTKHPCKCYPAAIEKYMGKISGPLLDRIDLHIEVPSVPFQELTASSDGTSSATMREQVNLAREKQSLRFGKSNFMLNSRMNSKQVRKFCVLNKESKSLLQIAMENLGLSARAHDRILRMARTIADLEQASEILAPHLIEAISYRSLDRKLWMK